MTCRTYLTLFVALLCLAGCSKSGSKPNTPPTDSTSTTATLNINCYAWFLGPQTEVIVSEPGGKILLDTVANNTGAPIIAALKTNDTLVDVTQVSPFAGTPTLIVKTIKSVNLARIHTLSFNGYGNEYKRPTASTKSQILYYNIPSQINLFNNTFFANYPENGLDGMETSQYSNVEVTYENYPGTYAYLLLPQSGLYNLHVQQNTVDSVDCSHLDTAVQLTFNRPVPFTTNSGVSALYGIFDTTDLSTAIAFTDYVQPYSKPGVDYEYAPIPVQKYEMEYGAILPNNDQLFVYAYTPVLPHTLPRPLGSDFSVSSSQTDDFSVTFPNTKPTFYLLYYQADSTIEYTMYISPDSATVRPMTFLTNLKSKLLQNAHVNNLKLNEFSMSDFDGLNYLNYCSYITSSTSLPHVTSVATLTRNY